MRTSAEIQKEIEEIIKKDKQYNYIVNEGGEGYEINSVSDELIEEFLAAKEKEFSQKWTLEFFTAQREIWNTEARKINQNQVTIKDQLNIEKQTGIKKDDLIKAKKLLGL